MDDLISRQVAIDAMVDFYDNVGFYGKEIAAKAIGIMQRIPSAQPEIARDIATIIENEKDMRVILKQPEIIRCNDCKYMTEHYDTDGNAPYWTCSEWDAGTDYDGFCHYAERRTDG